MKDRKLTFTIPVSGHFQRATIRTAVILPLAFSVASVHPYDPRTWSEIVYDEAVYHAESAKKGAICLAENIQNLDVTAYDLKTHESGIEKTIRTMDECVPRATRIGKILEIGGFVIRIGF